METVKVVYNDRIARQFALASIVWGVVGMAIGLLIALQLVLWQANLAPALSFGRLRPLHTNAVIFAFVGNMVFAGVYYSSQRLLKVRLPSDRLGAVHFWGWQFVIVAAGLTLPLGYTQGKEYAELEWPIDVAIALVWIVFAINFFSMVWRRNQPRLYIALWFYAATIVAVAGIHVVGSLAIPVGLLKSYSLFGGVKDALVQWWYGHNAVAFLMTMPALGIMYYLVPRVADRPVHSYRLAIVHFWALVFLFVWAGPNHLLNSALPDWAQSLGMIFGLMLWAPSWGGMINGLVTLGGARSRLDGDPVQKFLVAALVFYGVATLEGPLLGIKAVSGLLHHTDWIVGHAHLGGLGWNGYLAAAMFYWMIPRLFGTTLHSRAAANAHFYLATVGLLTYVAAMWIGGATQGLMWRAENPGGGLTYAFVQTVVALDVTRWARLVGGLLYLAGFILMGWNLLLTIRGGRPTDGATDVLPARSAAAEGLARLVLAPPVVISAGVIALVIAVGVVNPLAALTFVLLAVVLALGGFAVVSLSRDRSQPGWHRRLEGNGLALGVLVTLAVLVGSIAELIPVLATGEGEVPAAHRPYTALELEGRDVYLREGCYTCHSQMIRPFLWEVGRYGEVSSAADSVHDHPFQWGSRRVGPDLARVGGRYPNLWHFQHLVDPRAVSPGSNMPSYAHLVDEAVDLRGTAAKLRALRAVGVPYGASEIDGAQAAADVQAQAITADLLRSGQIDVAADTRVVALIAYLQRLGRPPTAAATAPEVP